ncbi:LysE family translocator [Microbacterium sediminicola]|uniref:LysE family translocator n=1 Tax=Microbacterium sediminicola TaxID=415210 RepID=A0ABN2HWX9_9MICO
MGLSALLAFWGVSALFVLTPGADWAYAISGGMNRRAVPAVAGMLTGHLLATLVVAAGVGMLVLQIPFALAVLTLAGASYLVWLGVGSLRHPAVVTAADGVAHGSWGRWYGGGFGVSGLNPKVFLLFLAVLPPFVDQASTWPPALQITTLGLVHIATTAVVYLMVGVAASVLLRSRPTAARIVSRVSGVAMIGIGLALAAEWMLHHL